MEHAPARRIVRDERFWPLVFFRWGRRPTAADYFAMFSDHERYFRRKQRFHVIHDTSDCAALPGAEERRIIAEMSREQEQAAARWVVGNLTVVPNRALHEVLAAVRWLVPQGARWALVESLPEAIDGAIVALRAEGLAAPPALLAYASELHARTA
jgi:hypothetical protein